MLAVAGPEHDQPTNQVLSTETGAHQTCHVAPMSGHILKRGAPSDKGKSNGLPEESAAAR